MAKKDTESPLLQQYGDLKKQYPGCILLMRVGDFYETFGADALLAAKLLGLTLTRRNNQTDMAGFPATSLDHYLPLFVRAGYRVAVCDQEEQSAPREGLLGRRVTQIATPGTISTDIDNPEDTNRNHFLGALHLAGDVYGIALVDVSTGEFYGGEGNAAFLTKILDGFKPVELVVEKPLADHFTGLLGSGAYPYELDSRYFEHHLAKDRLLSHFNLPSLKGFGLERLPQATIACGVVLQYLADTAHLPLLPMGTIQLLTPGNFLWMDPFTVRNLELVAPAGAPTAQTLYSVLDATVSPMGSRLLRHWLLLPLNDSNEIQERLDVVDYFVRETGVRAQIVDHIRACGDLERLTSKVIGQKMTPRQLRTFAQRLQEVAAVQDLCAGCVQVTLASVASRLDPCSSVATHLLHVLNETPEPGGLFREGVYDELDALKAQAAQYAGQVDYLLQREIAATGIHPLAIEKHHLYGYYFAVPLAYVPKVPSHWTRKQTVSNGERYITDELKGVEEQILQTGEAIGALETTLFKQALAEVAPYAPLLQSNAKILATLDCLASFAFTAAAHHYQKPILHTGTALELRDSRHPIIERHTDRSASGPGAYVANDLVLDPATQQIVILTGPNMSGKSAILRQTALITLMAHMGSFVPASYAFIPLTDKLFTRIGAQDNLSGGESTFMVEMHETARILNNITPRSLVLLDEIGRGTATYDGISIAWSIVEYLHQHPAQPKTLFATHYHELNDLEKTLPRVKNYHLTHVEGDQGIVFLFQLAPGGSTHSFGLHVAKMAGIPATVVDRAQLLLDGLEQNRVLL